MSDDDFGRRLAVEWVLRSANDDGKAVHVGYDSGLVCALGRMATHVVDIEDPREKFPRARSFGCIVDRHVLWKVVVWLGPDDRFGPRRES